MFGLRSLIEQFRSSHKNWIEDYLGDNGEKTREEEWTRSIAVGSKSFVEKVKDLLGVRAKGRDVTEGIKGDQLREEAAPYNALLGVKKDDIVPKNDYFWNINAK
jgi:putative transposase